jgi:hypothetical protein
MFYLYRHPIYDDEHTPILVGEFKDHTSAKRAIDSRVDDDWYFYSDFYIVSDT